MKLLKPKDLFIVGPTASGKSKLALELSTALDMPIVNCDSLQFFKTLKVGTAYPSDLDLKTADHLLFGIADAGQFFSAGEFIRQFEKLRKSTERPHASAVQFHMPCGVNNFLITGGSGFYIQALETGMEDVEELTKEMKHKISFLFDLSDEDKILKLKDVDPKAFEYIHPNDHYRIHRALEVYFSQGIKISDLKLASPKEKVSHPKLGVYLERPELLENVRSRVNQMFDQGLIDEVKAHVNLGLKDWNPLQSVGYKEVLMYLDKQVELKDLKDLIVKNTMYLAKRQMTWFRSDSNVVWFHAEKELDKAKLWALDFANKKV